MIARHNRYGVLMTVYAVVMITVFSSEGYDYWDLAVVVPALWFSFSYLVRVPDQDYFERLLATLVAATAAVMIVDFWTVYFSIGLEKQCRKDCIYNSDLILIVSIAAIALLLAVVFHTIQKKEEIDG
ncbi:MAG: hypothetical protein GQ535_02170 [Rhodobacteraceae bacterium]|nr:hypothetical protein [Paracoccaceae bacterium]